VRRSARLRELQRIVIEDDGLYEEIEGNSDDDFANVQDMVESEDEETDDEELEPMIGNYIPFPGTKRIAGSNVLGEASMDADSAEVVSSDLEEMAYALSIPTSVYKFSSVTFQNTATTKSRFNIRRTQEFQPVKRGKTHSSYPLAWFPNVRFGQLISSYGITFHLSIFWLRRDWLSKTSFLQQEVIAVLNSALNAAKMIPDRYEFYRSLDKNVASQYSAAASRLKNFECKSLSKAENVVHPMVPSSKQQSVNSDLPNMLGYVFLNIFWEAITDIANGAYKFDGYDTPVFHGFRDKPNAEFARMQIIAQNLFNNSIFVAQAAGFKSHWPVGWSFPRKVPICNNTVMTRYCKEGFLIVKQGLRGFFNYQETDHTFFSFDVGLNLRPLDNDKSFSLHGLKAARIVNLCSRKTKREEVQFDRAIGLASSPHYGTFFAIFSFLGS